MGLLSKFEGKMEDTVEGAADRIGRGPAVSRADCQEGREADAPREDGRRRQAVRSHALLPCSSNADDDRRLLGYYPHPGWRDRNLPFRQSRRAGPRHGRPAPCALPSSTMICATASSTSIAEMVASPPRWLSSYVRKSTPATASVPAAVRPARPPRKRATATSSPLPLRRQHPHPPAATTTRPLPSTSTWKTTTTRTTSRAKLISTTSPTTAPSRCPARPRPSGASRRTTSSSPDINVSRVHAEIRQDESGAWILTDLGSTNGTFVNGRQIKSTALHDADRIIVGTTNLEFQLI